MIEVSDREVGRWEQTLRDLKHRARNDRQIIVLMQEEMEHLRREIEKLKQRLYASLMVVTVVASILAWSIELIWAS